MGVCVYGCAIIPLILLKGGQAPEGLSHLVSSIVAKSPFVYFLEMLATSPFLHALMSCNKILPVSTHKWNNVQTLCDFSLLKCLLQLFFLNVTSTDLD